MPKKAEVWNTLASDDSEQVYRLVTELLKYQDLFVSDGREIKVLPASHELWSVVAANLNVAKKWVHTQVCENRRNVRLIAVKAWQVCFTLIRLAKITVNQLQCITRYVHTY